MKQFSRLGDFLRIKLKLLSVLSFYIFLGSPNTNVVLASNITEHADRDKGSENKSSVVLPLKCDPLPVDNPIDGYAAILSEIKTPQTTFMNLAPLYQEGLSGKGQTVGVVEYDISEELIPGLEQSITRWPKDLNKSNDDHGLCVAQVIASSAYAEHGGYIGIAPNAKISISTRTEELHLSGAIQCQVLNRVKCINLSIQTLSKDPHFAGQPSLHMQRGINFALKRGIPIFISGGNDQEVLGRQQFMTVLMDNISVKKSIPSAPPLFVLAFGFAWDTPVYDCEDIQFANKSARGSAEHKSFLSTALTGPYSHRVLKKIAQPSLNPLRENYDFATISGTSFSAPSLAALYCLLSEYADQVPVLQEGKKTIDAKDIIACMRGTAYTPPIRQQEEAEWYGAGIPDGGKALATIKVIVSARQAFKDKHYAGAYQRWLDVLSKLGKFSLNRHVKEALKAYYSSSNDNTVKLSPFFESLSQRHPSIYRRYQEEISSAVKLFDMQDYIQMYEELDWASQRVNYGEVRLVDVVLREGDKILWPEFQPAKSAYKKLQHWIVDTRYLGDGSSFSDEDKTKGESYIKGSIDAIKTMLARPSSADIRINRIYGYKLRQLILNFLLLFPTDYSSSSNFEVFMNSMYNNYQNDIDNLRREKDRLASLCKITE